MPNTTAENLDLRQYLRPVWARKWVILLVVAVVTAATYAYYNRETRLYHSTTSVFVQSSELEQALGNGPSYTDDRTTANQASLMLTSAVARDVAQRIKYQGDFRGLLGQISVRPRAGEDFIDLTATDSNPQRAADIANGFAEAFIATRSGELRARVRRARRAAQQELDATPVSDLTRTTRDELAARVRQLQVVESLPSGSAEQIDRAEANPVAFTPKPKRNAIFAAVLTFVLAIAAAFGLNRFDRRIRTLDDLELAYKLPLLSALPRVSDPTPAVGGVPVIAPGLREVCRSLRTNVELSALDRQLKTLVVISGVSGEGKSTVIRNLALVYAEAGSRVAVVEADVRRPTMVRIFHAQPGDGLTDVIAGEASLDDALQEVTFARQQPVRAAAGDGDGGEPVAIMERGFASGDITLLQSGPEPPNPPVMLGSDRMAGLLEDLRNDFDIVLIDSAPLLVVSDAVPMISSADGTIIVARLGETLRDAAKRVREVISRVPNANPLGIVANHASASEVAGGYRYYSYARRPRRRFFGRS